MIKSAHLPLLVVALIALGTSSCTEVSCGGSKEGFFNQFDNFLDKVDELEYDLDDKRWKPFDDRFRTFVEECYPHYEEEMSRTEKSTFWVKTLDFYTDRYGDGLAAELVSGHSELISEEVVKELEAVFEETGQKLADFLDRNSGEIESLLEQVGSDIEGWADRLKEILEE